MWPGLVTVVQDWVLLGGYTGVEGEEATRPRDSAEMLSLPSPAQYKVTCHVTCVVLTNFDIDVYQFSKYSKNT